MQEWSSAMKEAGESLAPVSLAVAGVGAVSLKASSDFESAMLKVSTIAGESADNIGALSEQVLAMSDDVGVGPKALADALLVVESTGIKGAAAMDILERSAKASAAGLGEAKDVARAVTAAITAYGAENLSASQATDILFQAVKEGGAEANEFAGTLGRVIGIASQVGVQFDEVAGYMATFTRLGVDADEAATALRGTLSTILHPAKQSRDELANLGISIDDLRRKVKENGLTDAMIELVSATNGNLDAIGTIIPNVRALAGVMGTAGVQAGKMREILESVKNSTGALDEAFERTTGTAAFQWAQFRAEVEKVAIAFGNELAPYAKQALDAAKPLLAMAVDLAKLFGDLPGPVKTAVVALLSLVAVSAPVVWGLGSVAGAASNLAKAFAWFIKTEGMIAVVAALKGFAEVTLTAMWTKLGLATDAANLFQASLLRLSMVLAPIALAVAIVTRSMEWYDEEQKKAAESARRMVDDQLKAERSFSRLPGQIDQVTTSLREHKSLREQLLDPKLNLAEIFNADIKPLTSHAPAAPKPGGGDAPGVSKELAEAIKSITEGYDKAKLAAQAYYAVIGGNLNRPKKQLEDYYDALQEVIDNFGSLRAAGLSSLEPIYSRLTSLVGATAEVDREMADWRRGGMKDVLEGQEKINADWVKEYVDAFLKIRELLDKASEANEKWTKQQRENAWEASQVTSAASQAMADLYLDNMQQMMEGSGNSFEAQLLDVDRWAANAKNAYFEAYGYSQEYFDLVDERAADTKALMEHERQIQKMARAYSDVGRVLSALEGASSGTFKNIVGYANQALGALASFSTGDWVGGITQTISIIGSAIADLATGEGTKVNDLRDEFVAAHGGAEALWQQLADIGRLDLWGPLMSGPAKMEAIEAAVGEVEDALADAEREARLLDDAMGRYGLSLNDVGTDVERFSRNVQMLVSDFRRLSDAGFTVGQISSAAADQLNEMLRQALKNGEMLPESLRPYLEELIRAGELNEDLARQMLGLGEATPWKDMQEAAERYGISVDSLGSKFHQAKFDETFRQMAADFKLLTENGADVNAVIAGMKDEVQELVNKAIKMGLTIPESMKPLLQAMIDAGELTDENGEKLTDLTKLTFARDLQADFQTLIDKLDELISRISGPGGLAESLGNLPSPNIPIPDPPSDPYDPTTNPQYQGTGSGSQGAAALDSWSRGADAAGVGALVREVRALRAEMATTIPRLAATAARDAAMAGPTRGRG